MSGGQREAMLARARCRGWHDPAVRIRNVDVVAVLLAASLPWSTSAVAIFAVIWLITLIPTLDFRAFARR